MGSADVDQEHDRELSFLFENLDIGMTITGGDVPVDTPDVVAELVFPDFGKGHTPAFESTVVLSGKDIPR